MEKKFIRAAFPGHKKKSRRPCLNLNIDRVINELGLGKLKKGGPAGGKMVLNAGPVRKKLPKVIRDLTKENGKRFIC